MSKQMVVLVIALFGGFLLSGCKSSDFSYKAQMQRVSLTTSPSGARVTQIKPLGWGEYELGYTPITGHSVAVLTEYKNKHISLRAYSDVMRQLGNVIVRIQKPGYLPVTVTLDMAGGQTDHHVEMVSVKEWESGDGASQAECATHEGMTCQQCLAHFDHCEKCQQALMGCGDPTCKDCHDEIETDGAVGEMGVPCE